MAGHVPQYGAVNDTSGAAQFVGSRVSSLSFRVTPIEFRRRRDSPWILVEMIVSKGVPGTA